MATQHRHSSLDQAVELLRDLIVAAVESSVPRLRLHPRSKAWWTQELTNKRKAMKTSQRIMKFLPSEDSHARYKQRRNDYFRSIKKSNTDMWNQYVEELDGPEVNKLMRRLRIRKTQQTPTI
ncbi:hypothetical protein BJ508DRAFT_218859, partial [Ascobolus immersus RN42]